ncbi:hypothetical protein K438DRAFT_1830649 [Mycena galopus ATCC 62051]|nr:hypothetical protein K438DRAFT_1830649 [Mycena galopus ATCC 62051]
MENFPITEAQIVALFLESVFWGIYLVTFFLCLRSLLFDSNLDWKRFANINWPMLIVTMIMSVFATLDVAVGLLHNIQAFIQYTGSGGAAEEFSHISDWVNIVKTIDCLCQTIVGDAMLIYRCWMIYGKSWRVVAFSLVLWLGCVVCTGMTLHIEATLHSNALITSGSLHPLIVAFWVLTITQTALTTGLIVFRIWRVEQENAPFVYNTNPSSPHKQQSRLRQVMRVIIESGIMYTAIASLTFITEMANSNSTYGVSDVEVQIVGITFNLIIIRAGRAASEKAGSTTLPLHDMFRRPVDGVHVAVVTREFRNEDGKVDTSDIE